jgi:hypothetical protein
MTMYGLSHPFICNRVIDECPTTYDEIAKLEYRIKEEITIESIKSKVLTVTIVAISKLE